MYLNKLPREKAFGLYDSEKILGPYGKGNFLDHVTEANFLDYMKQILTQEAFEAFKHSSIFDNAVFA